MIRAFPDVRPSSRDPRTNRPDEAEPAPPAHVGGSASPEVDQVARANRKKCLDRLAEAGERRLAPAPPIARQRAPGPRGQTLASRRRKNLAAPRPMRSPRLSERRQRSW